MEEISSVVNSIVKILECVICLNVSRDPVSIGCGHFFCRSCITKVLKESFRSACPLCMKAYTKRSIQEASQRKSIAKAVISVVEAAEKVLGNKITSSSSKLQLVQSTLDEESLSRSNNSALPKVVLADVLRKKRKSLETADQSDAERKNDVEQGSESYDKNGCSDSIKVKSAKKGLGRVSKKRLSINLGIDSDTDEDIFTTKGTDKEETGRQTTMHNFVKKMRKTTGSDVASEHSSSLVSDNKRRKSHPLSKSDRKFFDIQKKDEASSILSKANEIPIEDAAPDHSVVMDDTGTNKPHSTNLDGDCFEFVSSQNSTMGESVSVHRKKRPTKISKSKIKAFIQMKRKSKSPEKARGSSIEVQHSVDNALPLKLQNSQFSGRKPTGSPVQTDVKSCEKDCATRSPAKESPNKHLSSKSVSGSFTNNKLYEDELNTGSTSNYQEAVLPISTVEESVHSQESNTSECNDVMNVIEFPCTPPVTNKEENSKHTLCKSPGWSRIKQLNKDFHFKTFPTLHIQKSKAVVPSASYETADDTPDLSSPNVCGQKGDSPNNHLPLEDNSKTVDASCTLSTRILEGKHETLKHNSAQAAESQKNCLSFDLNDLDEINGEVDKYENAVNVVCEEKKVEGNEEVHQSHDADNGTSMCSFVPETVLDHGSRKQSTTVEHQPELSFTIDIQENMECPVDSSAAIISTVFEPKASLDVESSHESTSDSNSQHDNKPSVSKEAAKSSPDVLATNTAGCNPDSPIDFGERCDTPTSSHTLSQAFSHKKIRKKLNPLANSSMSTGEGSKVFKRKSHYSPRCKRFMSAKRAKKSSSPCNSLFGADDCSAQYSKPEELNGNQSRSSFPNSECVTQAAGHKVYEETPGNANRLVKGNFTLGGDVKTKVIKRLCLTFEEIETYFKSFYESGSTEMIYSVPLPSSDLLLQLNVSDETLNVSVLKVLKEDNPSVKKLNFHRTFSTESSEEKANLEEPAVKMMESYHEDDGTFPECAQQVMEETVPDRRKSSEKEKDMWFYADDDGCSLPETQPTHMFQTDQVSSKTDHKLDDMEVGIQKLDEMEQEIPKLDETEQEIPKLDEVEVQKLDKTDVDIRKLNKTEVETQEHSETEAEIQKIEETGVEIQKLCERQVEIPNQSISENINENGSLDMRYPIIDLCNEGSSHVHSDNHENKVPYICADSESLFAACNAESKTNTDFFRSTPKSNRIPGNSIITNSETIEKQCSNPQHNSYNSVLQNKKLNEENKDDFTASLPLSKNDVSSISPTLPFVDTNKHSHKSINDSFVETDERVNREKDIDNIEKDKHNATFNSEDQDNIDGVDYIPQSCPDSPEGSNIQEIDPFADTEDMISGLEPKFSETKLDDLIIGSEDYSSDPDMIFANNLVAPLKSIAEKMDTNKGNSENGKLDQSYKKSSLQNSHAKDSEERRRKKLSVKNNNKASGALHDSSLVSETTGVESSKKFNRLSKSGKHFKRIVTLGSDDSDDMLDDAAANSEQKKMKETSNIVTKPNGVTDASRLNNSRNDSTLHSTVSSGEIHTGAVDLMKLEIQKMNEQIKLLQEKITSAGGTCEKLVQLSAESENDSDDEEQTFRKPKSFPSRKSEADVLDDDSKESLDLFMEPIPPTPPN